MQLALRDAVRVARCCRGCSMVMLTHRVPDHRAATALPTHRSCMADEQKVQITGIAGDICTPPCVNNTCPTDVPPGVTAKPACALHDQAGDGYCALTCTPATADAQCGKNATCKTAGQGQGICTYDDIPPPPSSAHWKPVNSPTFEELGVVIDVAFTKDGKTGFAGAGSNGVGAQVVKTTDAGVTWKSIWPVQKVNSTPAFNIFLAGAAKSDTEAVIAGALFDVYTTDGIDFNASSNAFLSPAQDAHVLPDGRYALTGQFGNSSNGVMMSDDGREWTPVNMDGVNMTLFPARYAAFPSADVWYVTAGLFPNNNVKLTRGVRMNPDASGYELDFGAIESPDDDSSGPVDCSKDPDNCYSLAVVKTADGGKTWSVVYSDINTGHNVYPNGIDCWSETHCVFNMEGDTSSIMVTRDGGKTWKAGHHDTDSASSLMAVSFLSDTEVWSSGGHMTQADFEGRFFHSLDGGDTWVKEAIPDLYIIAFDMQTATSGYSVALTIQSGVELLKYDATGVQGTTPAITAELL